MSDSLREQLSAAYDAVEDGGKEEVVIENDNNEAEVESPAIEEEVKTQEEQVEEDVPVMEHWAPEDKEVFRSLDKRGKEFLLRRHKAMESDHTKKQQALADERRIAESFRKTMTPHEAYLKQLNIDPLQAFDKLISTELKLRTSSPQERGVLIRELARQYGAQFDPNEQVEQIDQKTQLILDEINKQQARIDRMEQDKLSIERRGLEDTIAAFSTSKTDTGSLKYPHFDTVRKDMGILMNAGKASSLEEAYEHAILLNSELRKEYINNMYRKEDTVKKAVSSKNAGFNVKSGSGGTISDPKKELSLRATIEQALDAQMRR